MTGLANKYQEEVRPKLKEELNITNELALPLLEKIVVNAGVAEAITSKEILEKVGDQLTKITGQKPKIARAKKAISSFKLKEGDPIGIVVTLRGKKAWDFLEKLINIVLPKMRDFRGVSETKFDKAGNYSLGLQEQILFAEIDYAKIDKIRGLVITMVIKNSNSEKSKRFMELLGVPFRKI